MFITFIAGTAVGFGFGVVFHHWWTRPDIAELKLHLEKTEKQLDMLSSIALRNANVKITRTNIKKIDVKKSEK